jgi:ClpX C4-type zinc finger
MIRRVSDQNRQDRCNFCRKRRYQVEAMAVAGDVRICNKCLVLCNYLAKHRWGKHRPLTTKK